MANQKLARNSRDSALEQKSYNNNASLAENSAESANVEETSLFKKIEIEIEKMKSNSISHTMSIILMLSILNLSFIRLLL